ncbi:hypothetical protein GCM10010121_059170 [Streptomyces brasiliensis]|uniref:Uncharacterized protein n=1 Tax=Streptomyces brasiliensis TaxID=1954 RepID=A0A917L4G8_9ACTN|nr:hypothetical protein GCM10010121_059170 [Streptomyces brasiliensis]
MRPAARARSSNAALDCAVPADAWPVIHTARRATAAVATDDNRGGLSLGPGPVTLAWTAAIVCFVGYVAVSRRDVQS